MEEPERLFRTGDIPTFVGKILWTSRQIREFTNQWERKSHKINDIKAPRGPVWEMWCGAGWAPQELGEKKMERCNCFLMLVLTVCWLVLSPGDSVQVYRVGLARITNTNTPKAERHIVWGVYSHISTVVTCFMAYKLILRKFSHKGLWLRQHLMVQNKD